MYGNMKRELLTSLKALGFPKTKTTKRTSDISFMKHYVELRTQQYVDLPSSQSARRNHLFIEEKNMAENQYYDALSKEKITETTNDESQACNNAPCSALYSSSCWKRVSQGTRRGSDVVQANPNSSKRETRSGVSGVLAPLYTPPSLIVVRTL